MTVLVVVLSDHCTPELGSFSCRKRGSNRRDDVSLVTFCDVKVNESDAFVACSKDAYIDTR